MVSTVENTLRVSSMSPLIQMPDLSTASPACPVSSQLGHLNTSTSSKEVLDTLPTITDHTKGLVAHIEEGKRPDILLRTSNFETSPSCGAVAEETQPSLDDQCVESVLRSLGHQTGAEGNSRCSSSHSRPAENLFLSTPLRLKHLARLSPSFLRDLLRSPSFFAYTPINSVLNDGDDRTETSGFHTTSSPWSSGDTIPTLEPCRLPLTPPDSGGIPSISQFSSSRSTDGGSEAHADGSRLPSMLCNQDILSPDVIRKFVDVVAELKSETTRSGHANALAPRPHSRPSFVHVNSEPVFSPMERPNLEERDESHEQSFLPPEFVVALEQQARIEEAESHHLMELSTKLKKWH